MPSQTTTVGLTPIAQRATVDIIAEQVRGMLAAGSYEQGAQLTETDLASALGVSRGPVREALQRLVQEGLLQNERNRGIFVRRIAPSDVLDIYHLREALEVAAMELIVQRGADAFVAEAERILAKMADQVAKGDRRRESQFDLAFHQLIIDESRSPRLVRAFATLSVETRMCLEALERTDTGTDTVAVHRRILAAIRDGDLEEARAAMRAHNATVLHDLRLGDLTTVAEES